MTKIQTIFLIGILMLVSLVTSVTYQVYTQDAHVMQTQEVSDVKLLEEKLDQVALVTESILVEALEMEKDVRDVEGSIFSQCINQ